MTLAAGTRLGPYEIHSLIGSGGMGEVYRARDGRLGRTVAIKILPSEVAADPDRRRRFEQEARAASALNHPHICVLHDIGSDAGSDYLVMEYLDGQTLAERLAKGRLPVAQALEYAVQIADALTAAHRQGIVHRDLKPGNVMVTKAGAKLLDFGLSRLTEPSPVAYPASVTLSASGTIVGTVPYMAPEQVQGLATDARTDIFAFGAVLYEMLTGRRAFDGESQASIIAAILEREPPPPSSLQPLTPPALDRIVRQCLAKSADDRPDTAHDVANDLRWIASPSAATGFDVPGHARTGRPWLRTAAAVPLLLLIAGSAMFVGQRLAPDSPAAPVARLTISVADFGLNLADWVVISPDGRTVAFVAYKTGEPRQLYVRDLGNYEPRALKGTEGAVNPFFSFDSQWIGYDTISRGMEKVRLTGGAPLHICDATDTYGATWGPDDRILFGTWTTPGPGLWSVPAGGGTPTRVVAPTTRQANVWFLWPDRLPGTDNVIFTGWKEGQASILAFAPGRRDPQDVVVKGRCARFLPEAGAMVYVSEGRLYAMRFDPVTLRTGAAEVAIDDLGERPIDVRAFDVSATGTLVYQPASAVRTRLVLKDRSGKTVPLLFDSRAYQWPAISPDGARVAVAVQNGAIRDIWVGTIADGRLTRLTFGRDAIFPIFSPDGRWVWFTAGTQQNYNIFRVPADGSSQPQRVTDGRPGERATSFSRDGRTVVLTEGSKGEYDVWQQESDRPDSARGLLNSSFNELNAVVSPDGRWIAYQSNESGQMEVYVQSYPQLGHKECVSDGWGMAPAWSGKGDELFFQGPAAVMAIPMADGRPTGRPIELFKFVAPWAWPRAWDVAADGRRFIAVETAATELKIVTNWFEELRAKLTGRR